MPPVKFVLMKLLWRGDPFVSSTDIKYSPFLIVAKWFVIFSKNVQKRAESVVFTFHLGVKNSFAFHITSRQEVSFFKSNWRESSAFRHLQNLLAPLGCDELRLLFPDSNLLFP